MHAIERPKWWGTRDPRARETHDKSYWEGSPPPEPLYTLGFIDILRGSDGSYAIDQELGRHVVEQLTDHGAKENRKLFIIYVHGTTHDGDSCDNHVRTFRRVLEYQALREHRVFGESAREVVGLYVGWRGRPAIQAHVRASDSAVGLIQILDLETGGPEGERFHDYLERLTAQRTGNSSKPAAATILVSQSHGTRLVFDAVRQFVKAKTVRRPVVDTLVFLHATEPWDRVMDEHGELHQAVQDDLQSFAGVTGFYHNTSDFVTRRLVGGINNRRVPTLLWHRFNTQVRSGQKTTGNYLCKLSDKAAEPGELERCMALTLKKPHLRRGKFWDDVDECRESLPKLEHEDTVSFYYMGPWWNTKAARSRQPHVGPSVVARSLKGRELVCEAGNEPIQFVFEAQGNVFDEEPDHVPNKRQTRTRTTVKDTRWGSKALRDQHGDIFREPLFRWIENLTEMEKGAGPDARRKRAHSTAERPPS